jgi:hypothetical protein
MSKTITRLLVTPMNLECPFCGAGVGKPCITSAGKGLRNDSLGAVLVHIARIKRAAQAKQKGYARPTGKQILVSPPWLL